MNSSKNIRSRSHVGPQHNIEMALSSCSLADPPQSLLATQLRLVLVGRTGAGKSATGNTILGADRFPSQVSMSSVTKECQKESGIVRGQDVAIIDTPGWFDTNIKPKELEEEVIRCLAMCSPGPHAVLLIIPIARFTEEQQRTVDMIEQTFQENITDHTIIIFTHADVLEGQPIEEFISKQDERIQALVKRFGNRFLAFNNKDQKNQDQVTQLFRKLEELLKRNEYLPFTNQTSENVNKILSVLEQKKEDVIAEAIKTAKEEVRKTGEIRRESITKALEQKQQVIENQRMFIIDKIDQLEDALIKEQKRPHSDPWRLRHWQESLQRKYDRLSKLEEENKKRITETNEELKNLDVWIQEEEKRTEEEKRETATKDGESRWYKDPFYFKILTHLVVFMGGAGLTPILLSLMTPAAPVGLMAQIAALVGPELAPVLTAAVGRITPLVVSQCSIQQATSHEQSDSKSRLFVNDTAFRFSVGPSHSTSKMSSCSPAGSAQSFNPAQLRLVLLGRTGAGKSATGNTILGADRFLSKVSMSSVTKECQKESGIVRGQDVAIIDTPGWFDTNIKPKELEEEVIRCLAMCSPGPHAFLLIIPIARFTEEQQRTVDMIEQTFQKNITDHTIIIFTHADVLEGQPIEEFISEQDERIQALVERFGNRFLAFNNKDQKNQDQVTQLFRKLEELLKKNEYRPFTNQISENVKKIISVLEQKKEAVIAEAIKTAKEEVRKTGEIRRESITKALEQKQQEIEQQRMFIIDHIYQLEDALIIEQECPRPDPWRLKHWQESLQREYDRLLKLEEENKKRITETNEELKNLDVWIHEEEKRTEEEERERATKDGASRWYKDPFYFKILTHLVVFMGGAGLGFAPMLLGLMTPAAPVGLMAQIAALVGPELVPILTAAVGRAAPLLASQCSIQ
ncbi:GTPase IMAP family member 8-like [Hoplias malabaricus]|uniref:GTPase IMAP family member 8-like n=1 Tax=Hoplias malabaricus TaxID=27720 RepID=UPI0034628AEF